MQGDFLFLFQNDLIALIPELFLVVISLSLLIYGVLFSTITTGNIGWLAILTQIFTIYLVSNNPIGAGLFLSNSIVIDSLTTSLKILILIVTISSILFSLNYIKYESIQAFEYILLILFSTSSMMLMVSSYDLIAMYLAIELQSLCFYALATSKRNSEFSTEAGLKYFILGAFSSGLLLFGCSFIYGFTGMTNLESLSKLFLNFPNIPWITETGIFIGMLFLAIGFLFKITAVPFHMWAPDVYEGAPTSVTAFFSLAPKIAILGLFIRLFSYSFYDFLLPWQKIFLFCSIASMILASTAALYQTKIKRLLAYSSIGHIGYMLMGLACGTISGIQALFLYLIIYLIMTVNVFSLLLGLQKKTTSYGYQYLRRIKYISDLRSLSKTNGILALTFSISLFSIAGIPPLAGFCSKFYLFFTAISNEFYFLAIIGVLTSVLSCFYYISIIKTMYFEKNINWPLWDGIPRENALLLGITFFFLIFFFLYPSPLFSLTHQMALALSL